MSEQRVAMAAAQFQRGDAAAAAHLLGPVLAAEPGHLRALVLMTHAQLALDRPALAHRAAQQAVRVAPDSAEALSALSRALTGLHRHGDAVRLATGAVRREPDNAHRHNRLAWALLGAGDRAADAEQAARQAVRLDPGDADLRITWAVTLKQLGHPDRARQALRDALAREPDNAVAQHELATLDVVHRNPFALGRLARGATGLAGALRADPRQQASRYMLDVALRRFLVGTAVVLALLAYVGWRVLEFSVPAARLLAATAVLAPAGFAASFVRRLDRPLRSYLAAVLTQGRQRIAAVLAAAAAALLLAATAAPEPWLSWLLGLAAAGGFAARLLTVSVSRTSARPAGGPRISTAALGVAAWATAVLGLLCLLDGLSSGLAGLLPVGGVLLAGAGAAVVVIVRRAVSGRNASQPG